jgi:hypothetical protein
MPQVKSFQKKKFNGEDLTSKNSTELTETPRMAMHLDEAANERRGHVNL